MKIGIRGKVFLGVGCFLTLYITLLSFLQWSIEARDSYVAKLVMNTKFEEAVQAVTLESKKYMTDGVSMDAKGKADLRHKIDAKFRSLRTLAADLPVNKDGVNRLTKAFHQGRIWIDARRQQTADRLYRRAVERLFLSKLKSGKDLARLAREDQRQLLLEEIQEMGWIIFQTIWALVALTALLTCFTAWWFTNYLTRNIDRLREAVAAAASGHAPSPLAVEGQDEFGELAAALNDMAKTLTASRERWVRSEKAAAAKELAHGAAHAINNPLSAIVGYTELLMRTDLSEPAKEDLRRIRDQAERCHQVIKNLVAASSRENAPRKVQVNSVIKDVLKGMEQDLKQEKIKLIAKLDPALPEVPGNFAELQKAFREIVGASREAVRDRAGKVLRVASEKSGEFLRITFADNGGETRFGTAADFLNPFYSALGAGNGAGLSLSAAYGAIRAQGGEITVSRRRGQGTMVLVELPLHP